MRSPSVPGGSGPPGEPPVEVLLVPPGSPLEPRVEEAARRAGLPLAQADDLAPSDLGGRVLVVDLTQARTQPRKQGRDVIAISPLTDLDAFDVIEPDRIEERLPRALRNAAELKRLQIAHRRDRRVLATLTGLGRALSEIDDRRRLVATALRHAREVFQAEAGAAWLVDGDELELVAVDHVSSAPALVPMRQPLASGTPEAFAVTTDQVLNVADLATLPEGSPYWPDERLAQAVATRPRSLLVLPLTDSAGRGMGVLELVNRTDGEGPAPRLGFDAGEVELAGSIASQVAVALQRLGLYEEIRELFDSFVGAAVTVIEARDPSTAGHSERVSRLTLELARACHASTEPPFEDVRFTEQELEELRYAALLHDFGKVGVREQVLLKADKLYPWELERLEFRFQLAALQAKLESTSREMAGSGLGHDLRRMEVDLALVRRLNRPDHRPQQRELVALRKIAERWRLLEDDEPVLSERELKRLCIPIGSLDPEERREIEQHVTHTWNFLRAIPWTPRLARVPELAYAHHEKLDGSGYPRGLTRDQIPFGARLMTVADIFDALTAGDRPYKAGMDHRKALFILREEAEAGRIERDVVELLAARRLWRVIRRGSDDSG